MRIPRTLIASVVLLAFSLRLEAGSVALEDFDTVVFDSSGSSVSDTISASWGTYAEGVFTPLFGTTQSAINAGYYDAPFNEFFVGLTQSDNTLLPAGTPLFVSIFNVAGGAGDSTWLSSAEQIVLSDPAWIAPTFTLTTPEDLWGLGTTTVAMPLAQFGGATGTYDHNNGSPRITLVSEAPEPPPSFAGPGNYSFTSGEKAKIGVEPIEGARYQWLKGGLPVRLARSNELDLTPGQSTFGPAQAGVYQLQLRQGTNTETLGPWVITHDDPTVLVYNLTLKGTQSTPPEDPRTAGASESPVTLGGFLLLDRAAHDGGVSAAVILTRTDRIGKKIVGRFYWSEDRPDVSVLSNGPVPGTAKLRPSRTLAAGLRGTETDELVEDPEAPLWLTGDRDMIWLSGSDALVKLDRSRTPSLVIAPATMTGFMGTAITTGGVGIDNFTVTAKINAADTLKAKNEVLPLEEMKVFIITRLEGLRLVPPFTEEVLEQ